MKALIVIGQAALALVIFFGAQGVVDAIDRATEERVAYRQFVADACTPGAGQAAINKRVGGQLHCSIYERADRGFEPKLVSVAVMEPPL